MFNHSTLFHLTSLVKEVAKLNFLNNRHFLIKEEKGGKKILK